MNVGRKLYYDKNTGLLIQDTGERSGDVVETTIDQDFNSYSTLAERVRDTVDVIYLEYREKEQDFQEGRLTGVNPITKELLFSYPDPQTPGDVTPPAPALSERITALENKTDQAIMELTMVIAMGGIA